MKNFAKRKWFKTIIAATVSVAMLSGVAAAAACDDDVQTAEYTVTYSYNYDGATDPYTTQTVTEGETATRPSADPSRDGYTFTEWYTDADCTAEVDFSAAITADVTYYAGWSLNTVDVTFVLYGDQTTVVSVATGGTVTLPDDPERDGYAFSGWYTDSDLTEAFDASAPVTEDTTVYAGWIEREEGYVIVTYMWNYEGASVYLRQSVQSGYRPGSVDDPERDGYLFMGWYTDAECTTAYETGRVTEDLTLYADWRYGYVFEAEYTNLYDEYDEPRVFYDYSGEVAGSEAVATDQTGTASNGYFIGGMYARGSYLYFEVESDSAVSDAVLTISLALGTGWGDTVTMTSEDFTITVNDVVVDYNDITFTYTPYGNLVYTTFAEYTLGTISLQEGTNVIRLEVTNSNGGGGGTRYAFSPYTDCITIYTSANLTWTPITSNIS